MAYKLVDKIEEVSIGQNLVYKGSIAYVVDEAQEVVYLGFNNKFLAISYDGIVEDNSIKSIIWGSKNLTKYLNANLIVFDIAEKDKTRRYLTITDKATHTPILIFKDGWYNREFCFKPVKSPGVRYDAAIGEIDKYSYAIAFNKSRLLDVPLPKTNYILKARKLLNQIKANNIIPNKYDVEAKNIIIPGLNQEEICRNYYINELEYIIKNFSNHEIYYCKLLNDIIDKFKIVDKYFKNFQG
ncbi:hypothetical protein ACSW8S_17600 (plasmid) [Clostridium perfringens]